MPGGGEAATAVQRSNARAPPTTSHTHPGTRAPNQGRGRIHLSGVGGAGVVRGLGPQSPGAVIESGLAGAAKIVPHQHRGLPGG